MEIPADPQTAIGLDGRQSRALIGLFEAEGHFAVGVRRRSDRGCLATVSSRDDDVEVLADFQRATGLGRIVRRRARGAAGARTCWAFASKLECAALADLLRKYPMYGRKRTEAAVWASAVHRWAEAPGAHEVREYLGLVQDRLALERRYRPDREKRSVPLPASEADLIDYFGGFFSGEGRFGLSAAPARVQIALTARLDDAPLLFCIAREFGIGKIDPIAGPGGTPAAVWHVSERSDLRRAIQILDAAPLLGRRRRQYAAWRPAALELAGACRERRPANANVLRHSRERLIAASRDRLQRA